MSGHSDGANTADQLRDLIRENQRLIAELRRRDEALAGVRQLAEELEGDAAAALEEYPSNPFDVPIVRDIRAAANSASVIADRIRAVLPTLAAHEQAEEAR